MQQRGELTAAELAQVRSNPWQAALEASHFVSHALNVARAGPVAGQVRTILDPHVQLTAQKILDGALTGLAKRQVRDGAVLIIDHRRNEILGWVVGRAAPAGGASASEDGGYAAVGYDTVLSGRDHQPHESPGVLRRWPRARQWRGIAVRDGTGVHGVGT
jgi:hypothetical protein